jgi:SAM-dependent methyltransferase
MNIEVVTEHPIAIDSLDHKFPLGTKQDNTPDTGFIRDIERHFNTHPLKFLDLGCSGGQLVADAIRRGHTAVGLEGSDYSLVNRRANWPQYAGKNLFTCDVSKDFKVLIDSEVTRFDCITMWDVLEHFVEDDLYGVFENVARNLDRGGIFAGSIYIGSAGVVNGIDHHRTQRSRDWWLEALGCWFAPIEPCPVTHWIRHGHLQFCMRKVGR